jgi:3'-phosphoadenosine 5'-phosphosulfate (PAPS) 3'-phosphatase
LDGTSDFVKGNLPAVTVLIGLSIAGKSRAGIVHNPFSFEDQAQSLTYFGTAEHGVYKLNYNIAMTAEESVKREIHYMPPFDHFEVPADDHKIRVAASL